MANTRTVLVDHGRERSRRRGPQAPRRPVGGGGDGRGSPLNEIQAFGADPGSLAMLAYAPKDLKRGAPLVVVLHGCSQNARGYDAASGWSALADELGFAVLFPEQRVSNNHGGCFNWFLPADTSRGLGESRSIREMVEHMTRVHHIDRGRVFVTGLSAGGAMTSALLADYPELFAAGAVIAGLPCGAATSMQDAFMQMSQPTARTPAQLGDLVRASAPDSGGWPRVAIFHGTKDTTVSPKNADELVKQWVEVHGAALGDFRESFIEGHRRRVWSVDSRDVVESIMIAGMGHGAPLDGRLGEQKAPFMLDVGLSSTRRIADFFGIEGALEAQPQAESEARASEDEATQPWSLGWASGSWGQPSWASKILTPSSSPTGATKGAPERERAESERAKASGPAGRLDVGSVIEKALKAAGLVK